MNLGSVKKMAPGKYRLRISAGFDDYGKRIQLSKVVYCNSDREAQKLLAEFYTEREQMIEERSYTTPITLEDLYKEWYKNHVDRNLSIRTKQFYENLWRTHIVPYAALKLEHIKPRNLFDILDPIQGDRTKKGVYAMLKALFQKGIQWGYLKDNPCNRIDPPKYRAKEKQTLNQEDIEKIMEVLPQEALKYQAMFYLGCICGMRKQEIIGLKWEDVDATKNTLHIKRAAISVTGKGTQIKETKTAKSNRVLFLPDIVKNILSELQKEQNQIIHMLGDKWTGNGYIFTQATGNIMDLNTPSKWWNQFSQTHHLCKTTFHGLRHTAATLMIKNNMPISTVSGVLGHANIGTTLNTYTHVIEDTKKEAIQSLNNIFQTKK